MTAASQFAPYGSLAETLFYAISDTSGDGAHDLSHVLRVWANVCRIMVVEGGDRVVLTAATILHDCVDVPKNSPDRASASRRSAARAADLLAGLGWDITQSEQVRHAIEAHSFSANVTPRTIEAKILQDADRLDAIGHIGIARCFYVSGQLGHAIYDPVDPTADARVLDDQTYALDHFRTKLFHLAGSFQTQTGRLLGAERHRIMKEFVDGLLVDITLPRNSE